jgi:hypothetical protein
MTPTPRKSGIRLPWSHDEDSDATQATETGAETSEAPETTDASATAQGAQASATPAPAPSAAAVGEAAPATHEPASVETTDPSDNALLASLITAMREVAERERESSVSTLRLSVDESVETLRKRAAEQAEQLRERSEGDITAIGDWVTAETERIAAEGERRRETRRQLLTQQLSDHEQRSGTEIESLYARIQDYERDLTTFFAQLHDINDPAAFGTAAKRMPRPPSIAATPAATSAQAEAPVEAVASPAPEAAVEGAGETKTDAAPEPTAEATSADTTPAEIASETAGETASDAATDETTASDEGAGEQTASDESATAESAAVEGSDQPADQPAAQGSSIVPDTHDARLSALGIDRNGSEAEASEDEPATQTAAADTSTEMPSAETEGEPHSDPLRARLAELDAKIGGETSGEPATATVVAPGAAGEVATAIVVHGLGSFGAITSFKQALERVDGVHGISLSLGPTGEFVYRATHEAEFDLVTAIEQIEHGGAQIERQADGSLRVVVQRGR